MSVNLFRALKRGPQLEVNDRLNDRSSREIHANDSQTLAQVALGLQVVVQHGIDAQSDGPGVRKHACSAAVGEEYLGHVSCWSSLQVLIDALPFVHHI